MQLWVWLAQPEVAGFEARVQRQSGIKKECVDNKVETKSPDLGAKQDTWLRRATKLKIRSSHGANYRWSREF